MTGTPGADEKVCPFCAEVIKAAAIKCRYCQSVLPIDDEADEEPGDLIPAAGTAHDIRDPEPSPAIAGDVPTKEPAEEAAATARPVLTRATALLLALALVLAAGIVGIWLSARPDDLRTAGNGQVTATGYRSAAMSAAAANASTVLSYSYKTLDADQKKARAVISDGFAKEYADVMAKAGPTATQAKLTLKATVMATSLISLHESKAKVMLFVNTITTTEGSEKQQLNQNRVLVEMTRDDGDWIVSKMDAF